ncbi:MAG: Txe/YoeB family addiction module toxin [Pseudomonadota bacterium]|nr:Txe/YoeB family addiction module toxin [Pseudomonadota bacterium]
MKLVFHPQAWDDYVAWQGTSEALSQRLGQLIEAIVADPHHGMGKPQALKDDLADFWSRRITAEHRIVYRVENDELLIAQCRQHDD